MKGRILYSHDTMALDSGLTVPWLRVRFERSPSEWKSTEILRLAEYAKHLLHRRFAHKNGISWSPF